MTTVYIDLVFLLNLIADYLLLLAGGRMSGCVLRRGRMALGAATGAVYSCILFLPGAGWLSRWPCKVCCGVLMAVIAYGAGVRLLRSTVMFFASSTALGGTVYAAQFLGSGPLTMENGVLYSTFDVRLLLLLFVLCYAVLSLFFRRIGQHGREELVALDIGLLGKRFKLTALRDTGNTLTDPVTNRPVVVVDAEAIGHILPPETAPATPVDSAERLSRMGVKGVRLLPFRAVGTEFGLLLALRADHVIANGVPLGPLLIALSPGPVGDGGRYQGLIGGF